MPATFDRPILKMGLSFGKLIHSFFILPLYLRLMGFLMPPTLWVKIRRGSKIENFRNFHIILLEGVYYEDQSVQCENTFLFGKYQGLADSILAPRVIRDSHPKKNGTDGVLVHTLHQKKFGSKKKNSGRKIILKKTI